MVKFIYRQIYVRESLPWYQLREGGVGPSATLYALETGKPLASVGNRTKTPLLSNPTELRSYSKITHCHK